MVLQKLSRDSSNLLTHESFIYRPSWDVLDYRSLSELTIGILGLGDIGQEIAKYCTSMKMTVNAIRRTHPATKLPYVDECFCLENLSECLKNCDYLCSVLPSTPSTKGLLSGSVLESCKEKKTVLINVGRGDVIRSEEILQALNNQWIGGAILDVFEEEPLPKDSALWTHPEVTITPHVAGLSPRSQVKLVYKNIINMIYYHSLYSILNFDWFIYL